MKFPPEDPDALTMAEIQNCILHNDDTRNYPPAAPPVGKKSDVFDQAKFEAVDKRAQQAPEKLLLSFDQLLGYLLEGLTSDVQKVRALYVWLGSQELYQDIYTRTDAANYTPYMFLKQFGLKGGHNVIFIHLCRLAGLPCVCVRGINKNVWSYRPGDFELNQAWSAVHVDGFWRLMIPDFTGVTVKAPPGTVIIEDSGQALRDRVEGKLEGTTFREEYFLPDPDVLIYQALPEESKWQLLEQPWTEDKFISTPNFSRYYLRSPWHLSDKLKAVTPAPEGRACILFDKLPEGDVTINYTLFYDENKSKRKFPDDKQVEEYVVKMKSPDTRFLLLRLPLNGIYYLKLKDVKNTKLCELRIDVTGVGKTQKRFPAVPELGYGFSQEAVQAGLLDPSRDEGVLVAREGEKVRFRFRTRKPLDVRARLVHSILPSQELENRLTQEEEEDTITIHVKVPYEANNPEFALQIDAKERDGDGDFLRDELEKAIADDHPDRLEIAIRVFRNEHVTDDKQQLNQAYQRLVDLYPISDAIEKRDHVALHDIISKADLSQVAYLLHRTEWFPEAKVTLRRLRRLARVSHDVVELKPSLISEVHSYNKPPPAVKTTVMATFLLLGENKKTVQKWKRLQSLLRATGQKSVLRRIQNQNVADISMQHVTQARELLSTCNAEEIRTISVCAVAFYDWTSDGSQVRKETMRNRTALRVKNARSVEAPHKAPRKEVPAADRRLSAAGTIKQTA
ncbi:hypothetical protein BaRGS_00034645 [Batillaria attramentaria]|uniref:Transglutaminase-like domain-containing protein n=1 Tax=Batillaria attramentaria TaxID=370345 RepID=A0ABD0JGT1_9CAEN